MHLVEYKRLQVNHRDGFKFDNKIFSSTFINPYHHSYYILTQAYLVIHLVGYIKKKQLKINQRDGNQSQSCWNS